MDNSKEFIAMAESNLESARVLLNMEKYRNVISLGYYAMFYSASALLSKKEIFPKSHKGLISEFYKEYVRDGNFNPDIAKYLGRAESNREIADYETFIEFSEEKALQTLEDAEIFINETRKFL